jgi:hypothetical protein
MKLFFCWTGFHGANKLALFVGADSAPTNLVESLVNFSGTKICWQNLLAQLDRCLRRRQIFQIEIQRSFRMEIAQFLNCVITACGNHFLTDYLASLGDVARCGFWTEFIKGKVGVQSVTSSSEKQCVCHTVTLKCHSLSHQSLRPEISGT